MLANLKIIKLYDMCARMPLWRERSRSATSRLLRPSRSAHVVSQGIAKWQVDRAELDDLLIQRMFVVPAFEVRPHLACKPVRLRHDRAPCSLRTAVHADLQWCCWFV